jgi:hypothetical protein
VKGLPSEHMCAARRASRYGSTGMQDRRRDGYEMAFEGIRLVLSSTPADDPERPDLLELYHALGDLAERGALRLVRPDELAGSSEAQRPLMLPSG